MSSLFQIANYINYYLPTLRFNAREIRFPLLSDKSEPIHVIANGPTFNDTCKYINEIPGKTMMCNFALNNFTLFVPDYYVLADPKLMCIDPDYRGEYYNCIKESNREVDLKMMSELREKLLMVDKEMVIICPSSLNLEHVICNPKISWKYVNTSTYIPIAVKGALKRWKNNKVAPRIAGVPVLEIFSALHLGYKTIYLHGCEASDFFGNANKVNQDNNMLSFVARHFYDNEKDSEIFWKDENMLNFLRAEEILFTSLYELQDYSKHLNARIINMSKNSWVDCFERYIEKR